MTESVNDFNEQDPPPMQGEPPSLRAMTPQVLEDRLIDFAVLIIGVVEGLPQTKAANHIAGQLIRSGTSPAPNYAEARGAESANDFSHKLKISLKELRESLVWLKIIARKSLGDPSSVSTALNECDQLIAIFVCSTKTNDQRRR